MSRLTGESISDESLATAILLYLDGYSYRAIGKQIDSTHQTVKVALESERGQAIAEEFRPLLNLLNIQAWYTKHRLMAVGTPPVVQQQTSKEVIDRTEGETEQRLRIYDGDARDKLDAKLADIASRRGEEGSD